MIPMLTTFLKPLETSEDICKKLSTLSCFQKLVHMETSSFQKIFTVTVRDSASLRINICVQRGLLVYFQPTDIKKTDIVIYSTYYTYYILRLFFL
jgi:hypothetical protein